MTTEPDDLRLVLARQAVGVVTVIPDATVPGHVLHLTDAHGIHYFAKQHHRLSRLQREVTAYREWTRHLACQTPELIAHHPDSGIILLTAVAGQRADTLPMASDAEKRAHRAAGVTLRSLHDATTVANAQLGTEISDRLANWIDQAVQLALVSRAQEWVLRAHARQLRGQDVESAVCHLDYQPRNWFAGPAFAVIDFEHTRLDARVRDLARLAHRYWPSSPHLRKAFLNGYGRLSDEEEELLQHFAAYEAATALVRGHETGNPVLTQHGRAILTLLLP
ncbi:aminoglycoside phosphotransferase family protein [Kitasatospora sp. LaBMicrA B282]|uniref:aminoglycoside phosphotransferase family protein n=1 Tax=Kitasatospora sp. LaBMicrA B282 TaxID=3420949 RepID=UPI003D150700